MKLTIKTIALLLIILILTMFSGCVKTNKDITSPDNLIGGTYNEGTESLEDNNASDDNTEKPIDFSRALPNPYGIEMIDYNYVVREEFEGDVVLSMSVHLSQNIGDDEIVTFVPVGVPDNKELPLLHDMLSLVPGEKSGKGFIYEMLFDVEEYEVIEGTKPRYPFNVVALKPLFEDVRVIPYSSALDGLLWEKRNDDEIVAILSLDDKVEIPNVVIYQRLTDEYLEIEYTFYDLKNKEWYTFKVERDDF